MAKTYRPYDPKQNLLLPPSLDDWLPAGHPARFVNDIIDTMDLTPVYAEYEKEERGYPPYDPAMMLKTTIYGYMTGIRSSRKLQQATEDQVPFRYLAAGNYPKFRSICSFRARHVDFFKDAFKQVVKLAKQEGLVGLRLVATDGTKMKANASLAANKTLEDLEKEDAELCAHIDRILREADAADAQEDAEYGDDSGLDMPKALEDAVERRGRIRRAMDRLKQQAEERKQAHEEKLRQRAAKETETGKKLRGRKPKAPDPAELNKKKANTTDPESRIMKARQGFVQAYNAQATVDAEHGIVVAAYVTNAQTDTHELGRSLEETNDNTGQYPERSAADAGYWSPEEVAAVPPDVDAFVATAKTHTMRQEMAKQPPRGRIPKDLTLRQRMERKLRTQRGWAWYRLRGQTVEPAFGDTRENRGFKTFLLRGLRKADAEWQLVQMGRNLWKIWKHRAVPS